MRRPALTAATENKANTRPIALFGITCGPGFDSAARNDYDKREQRRQPAY
jgi:hypothetical protein